MQFLQSEGSAGLAAALQAVAFKANQSSRGLPALLLPLTSQRPLQSSLVQSEPHYRLILAFTN